MRVTFTFGRFNIPTSGGHGHLVNIVEHLGDDHAVVMSTASNNNPFEMRAQALASVTDRHINIVGSSNIFQWVEQQDLFNELLFIVGEDQRGLAQALSNHFPNVEYMLLERNSASPSSTAYRVLFNALRNGEIDRETALASAMTQNLCDCEAQFNRAYQLYLTEIS